MNYQEKLNTISQLVQLAKVDNEINTVELNFIRKVAKHTGVSPEDLQRAMDNQEEYQPPKDAFDRITQFHQLLLLMMIDKTATEEEVDFINEFAMRAALNNLAVQEIVNRMVENDGKPLSPEEILSVFRVFYN